MREDLHLILGRELEEIKQEIEKKQEELDLLKEQKKAINDWLRQLRQLRGASSVAKKGERKKRCGKLEPKIVGILKGISYPMTISKVCWELKRKEGIEPTESAVRKALNRLADKNEIERIVSGKRVMFQLKEKEDVQEF